MVFPVVTYGCESWTVKKAERRRTDAFELWCWGRFLRNPWTARRSNQSILKEISSWVFIGRTDAEAETPILWPTDAKNWLTGKDPDAGRDWGQDEKGMTEDETAGWHHQLDGREFVWAPGVGDGQGGLACCDSWGRQSQTRLSDWTELNWTEEGIDKTWSQKGKGHLALSLPPTECCFRVQWSHLYQAPFWFFIFHHREFWAYTE